jgi:hypothetical protein
MKKSQIIETEQCSDDECDCHVYNKYVDVILKYTPFGIGWKIARYQSNVRWWLKCRYQKFKYGVSDDDIFDLNLNISRYILPRLIYFKQKGKKGMPSEFIPDNYHELNKEDTQIAEEKADKEWNAILDDIIFAFDYSIDPDKHCPMPEILVKNFSAHDFDREETAEEKQAWNDYVALSAELCKRKQNGLRLFSEHFDNLWT